MKVRVQFFSHLRDRIGTAATEIEIPSGATAGELLAALYRWHPSLAAWDKSILLGAGVEFVDRDHVLRPDEEIAIMPPVQGG